MTVAELIKALQKQDPTDVIILENSDLNGQILYCSGKDGFVDIVVEKPDPVKRAKELKKIANEENINLAQFVQSELDEVDYAAFL